MGQWGKGRGSGSSLKAHTGHPPSGTQGGQHSRAFRGSPGRAWPLPVAPGRLGWGAARPSCLFMGQRRVGSGPVLGPQEGTQGLQLWAPHTLAYPWLLMTHGTCCSVKQEQ